MKAIVMHERGGSAVLQYEDAPKPSPAPDEVLIQIQAATVNHTDIFHRTGQFFIQKDLPHILGMDVAGIIVELGASVQAWQIGDRVVATFEALGRERNGAYAEYTTLPASQLYKIPTNLDYVGAASIGLAFTSAWIALIQVGQLQENEEVIIQAASSGVGTAAIQIARWKNARIIAVSDKAKAARLEELGASIVVDRNSLDLTEQLQLATGTGGASFVLDLVGQPTLQTSLSALARYGRIICVGTLGGDVAQINVMDLIMKAATIRGSFGVISSADFEQILELFANKTFQPVIDRTMPLSQARQAHDRIEAKQGFGKIVLIPDSLYKS